DIAAIPVLRGETHLPVIVDPSHAGGRADLVAPLAYAAIAAGADGLLVEVHPRPETALSDGEQSLSLDGFTELMPGLAAVAAAARRAAAAKRSAGLPTLDPGQEAAVVRRAAALAREGGLPEEAVRDLFWHLVGLTRRAEQDASATAAEQRQL